MVIFEQTIYKLVHGMVIKIYTDPPQWGKVGILGMRLRHKHVNHCIYVSRVTL